ncbi:hypothetical protein DFJ77DRAFT_462007 [Powellomyces hirtus]|nr:hypothetical protein DFJ77DRAFT_462007 [Powellomyces hirtus]
MAEVRVLVENLKNIGLYEEARTAILATAKKTIKERVEECRGEYEERHLNDCLEWVTCRVSDNWLSAIDTTSEVDASHRQAIPTFDWSHVLRMSTYQGFCSMRISEMFDLIRDAIDTLPAPALLDLKDCLKTSVQKDELVESLKTVLEARILHAGVATEDIVSLFIATENCLRLLDPSSNLLLRTIEPMKQYLRRRPDTVKHILTRMLDQNSELAEAMREPDNCVDDEDFDDSADWNPEPIDAVGSRQERNVDIITRLISVFENKEVFVNEFHKILLESLLHKTGYDTEQETMELELLKIRFGEASFHQCEVMLLDMAVSRRLHKHIREGSLAASRAIELEPEEDMFHVTTISHLFWPTINTCEFRIPFPNISSAQAAYAKQFQEQKPNRKLKWKPNAGLVEVELEMGDGRCKTYTVTELQAAVIYHFGAESRNGTSSIGDIVEDLRSQGSSSDFEEDIRDCVQLWIGHSVLKEVSLDCWEVVETLDPDASGSGGSTSIIHGARKSEEERARAKEEAEMRSKFQPMIVALLTNQGAQNAEKIQSILAMFFQFSHPMADLQKMLDHMVAEGMLALAMNGKYSVRV